MRIPVSGMSCQACATTIQGAISKLPGAREVHVNFALKQLSYEGLETDLVISKLQELGYDSPRIQEASPFQIKEATKLSHEEGITAFRRFILAFVLGFPEFLIGMGLWPHGFYHWPPVMDAILASVVVIFAGFDIHKRTFMQLKNGNVNMDTLVTLGSGAGLLKAFVLLARGSMMPGFEVASTIIVFILFGRYLEAISRKKTFSASSQLYLALQRSVSRIIGEREEQVSGLELKVGDHIRLKPGEVSPVDGIVVEGKALIGDQTLTGEIKPKSIEKGSKIISGSTIIDSSIVILVKNAGEKSFLGQLIIELEQAQARPAPIQGIADKVTSFFVPGVILFACLAAVVQFLVRGATPEFSLNVFLSVVLTACPCALGLAIPTALVAGLGASAQWGILFREPKALEACGGITEIFFDKTGTLTEGRPQLEKIEVASRQTENELLTYAAALNRYTTHPLGRALTDAAFGKKIFALPPVENLKIKPGEGVEGDVKGQRVALLRCKDKGEEEGTSSELWVEGEVRGRFIFRDALLPETPEILRLLKSKGLACHVLTGDSITSVRQLGLDKMVESVRAGLSPQDKEFVVRASREKNPNGVAFIGDGINDTLALTRATVGIAIANGAPAALAAGAVSLTHGIKDLPRVFFFAKKVSRQLKFNLFWALGYNVVMLPFAASGDIPPMFSSLAMAMSSVSVVLGSVWLGFSLRKGTGYLFG